jgi:hypothetical protein
MKYERLRYKNGKKLKTLGVKLKRINTIRFRGKESFSHRVVKLILCHLITKQGHFFTTEQPIKDGVCDVFDLNDLIIYEIEAYPNSTIIRRKLDIFHHPYIEDLIIINLRKIDYNWLHIYRLRDKLKKVCGLL